MTQDNIVSNDTKSESLSESQLCTRCQEANMVLCQNFDTTYYSCADCGHVEKTKEVCRYGGKGYPSCHCNICLDAITEYEGFKKGSRFMYRGTPIIIETFCPLEHCMPIFIVGRKKESALCEWINLEQARNELLPETTQNKEQSKK